jgi:folate-dependent phosphoribosylglycinamide formyltransferase PurN
VPVLAGDTPESLHERIHQAEHRAYPEAIRRVAGAGFFLPQRGASGVGWGRE